MIIFCCMYPKTNWTLMVGLEPTREPRGDSRSHDVTLCLPFHHICPRQELPTPWDMTPSSHSLIRILIIHPYQSFYVLRHRCYRLSNFVSHTNSRTYYRLLFYLYEINLWGEPRYRTPSGYPDDSLSRRSRTLFGWLSINGCGRRIWTSDLQGMNLLLYQAELSRDNGGWWW